MRIRSLAGKHAILIFASTAFFSIVLAAAAFVMVGTWMRSSTVTNLEALASVRETALNDRMRDIRGHDIALSRFHLVARLQRFFAASGDAREEIRGELTRRLQREHASSDHILFIGVFAPDRAPIATSGRAACAIEALERPETFSQALVRPVLNDPVLEQGTLCLDLLSPIRDPNGTPTAVLVLQHDARPIIDVVGDYTGLGESGETVLGTRREGFVHFLAPLRFDPSLATIEPARVGGLRAGPMVHATAGQSGITTAQDYRGVDVLAAFRPVEGTSWGLVVKQDTAEAFSSANDLMVAMAATLAGVLLLAGLIAWPLTRTILRPLRELLSATQAVAQGNLEVTVPETQNDEAGDLAASFNTMVKKLYRANEELLRANKELDAFAYVVSHDLKAPLRGIANLSSWLKEDLAGDLEEEQSEQLDLIEGRVLRMQDLIDGLLEYSRVGRQKTSSAQLNSEKLVRSVILSLSPPKGARFNTHDLPSLVSDELCLTQVFQNLLENAIKHHPSAECVIDVSCTESADCFEFTVRDDGDGIAPNHHERIFGIFQTLTTEADASSTGIGLALVKRIVEEVGGAIRLESTGLPGEGAAFIFTWPRTLAASREAS